MAETKKPITPEPFKIPKPGEIKTINIRPGNVTPSSPGTSSPQSSNYSDIPTPSATPPSDNGFNPPAEEPTDQSQENPEQEDQPDKKQSGKKPDQKKPGPKKPNDRKINKSDFPNNSKIPNKSIPTGTGAGTTAGATGATSAATGAGATATATAAGTGAAATGATAGAAAASAGAGPAGWAVLAALAAKWLKDKFQKQLQKNGPIIVIGAFAILLIFFVAPIFLLISAFFGVGGGGQSAKRSDGLSRQITPAGSPSDFPRGGYALDNANQWLLKQNDELWVKECKKINDEANREICSASDIASAGCHLTSQAMLLKFHGQNITPPILYSKYGIGPDAKTTATAYNMSAKEYWSSDFNGYIKFINDQIINNKLPVVIGVGPQVGLANGSSHFMVLTGYDDKAKTVKVNDPGGSRENITFSHLQQSPYPNTAMGGACSDGTNCYYAYVFMRNDAKK